MEKIFHISTLKNPKSIKSLLKEIKLHCTTLLDKYTNNIPTSYQLLLEDITSVDCHNHIMTLQTFKDSPKGKNWTSDPDLLMRALHHLHSIGQIVLFGDQLVCTDPSSISRIMAKFISPAKVRYSLLKRDHENVSLLTETNIVCILGLNKRYLHLLIPFLFSYE